MAKRIADLPCMVQKLRPGLSRQKMVVDSNRE